MKTNDDRQHLTQAQLRLAVTLFWGSCQQVLLPARLKELAKVINGAKNRYSIHRNLPLLTKVCLLYPLHILGYAGSFFTSLTSNSRLVKVCRADWGRCMASTRAANSASTCCSWPCRSRCRQSANHCWQARVRPSSQALAPLYRFCAVG